MIYCTYCGKSFTRKEHLERHLPTHTNVKPHRCQHCSLAFARRDLLSRHLIAYHVEKDDMQRAPGGVHTLNGRTQIACRSCAQAKTGCDKRLPDCTRCVEKKIKCETRYARRSSKAAARLEAAGASHEQQDASMLAPVPEAKENNTTAMPSLRSIGVQAAQLDIRPRASTSTEEGSMIVDHQVSQHGNLPMKDLSADPLPGPQGYYTTPSLMADLHDVLQYDSGFVPRGIGTWEYTDLSYDSIMNLQTPQDNLPGSTFVLSPPSANSETFSPTISVHTRRNSMMSPQVLEIAVGEMEPGNPPDGQSQALQTMIAAESGWPLAQCNPPLYSGHCPQTASLHLNHLNRTLNHEGAYNSLAALSMAAERHGRDLPFVTPIRPETRDKILAIAQSFLHKALDTHNNGHNYDNERHNTDPGLLTFLVLPSSENLGYFLQSYVRSLHFYYSLVSSSRLDPNDMIKRNQTATLLVLFMIAQGASVVPIEEARALSTGLIETCRRSLFDIVEKNMPMCADSTVHRCGLIFTLLAAWSGDKWLMDIAMGQRNMYLEMLQHAGMFKKPESPMAFPLDSVAINEKAWRSWLDRETMNRLVYNWVMVDQELSLFHDTAPLLALKNLHAPMPGPEEWWTSMNGNYWMMAMSTIPDSSSLTPSLYDLFQDFLCDRLSAEQAASLSPYRMRLLLHPIHSGLWYSKTMKLHYSDPSVNEAKAPTLPSQDKALLERWRSICYSHFDRDSTCLVTQTNLVLSHLISLNDLTYFPAIEQYARGQLENNPLFNFPSSEAVYHCGQVLRIVRAMPADQRPVWWSIAVYRVMLILWIFTLCRGNAVVDQNTSLDESAPTDPTLVIDLPGLVGESVFDFLWKDNIVVLLSRRQGPHMDLSEHSNVLGYAVEILNEGVSTRFRDGIKRKLIKLHTRWYSVPLTE